MVLTAQRTGSNCAGLAKMVSPRGFLALVERRERPFWSCRLRRRTSQISGTFGPSVFRHILQRADIGGDVLTSAPSPRVAR